MVCAEASVFGGQVAAFHCVVGSGLLSSSYNASCCVGSEPHPYGVI
jgi:hypothetical protein